MMNIVIALKEFPAVIDSSFGFVAALCRNRGKHEVILTLDGRYARTVDRVRSAFEGILPQENIHLQILLLTAGLLPAGSKKSDS